MGKGGGGYVGKMDGAMTCGGEVDIEAEHMEGR